jgi:hypothetical protein
MERTVPLAIALKTKIMTTFILAVPFFGIVRVDNEADNVG